MNKPASDDDQPTPRSEKRATYSVVDADIEQDCAAAADIWEGILGWTGRFPEMYNAFYLDCPVGQPRLKFLRHDQSQSYVGTVGIGPRRVLWKGREIRAAVISHLCVKSAHRSVRPALLLLRSQEEEVARRGFDVGYGLPSSEGAALSKLAGYKIGGQLIRYAKVLRYENYAARLLPRVLAIPAGRALDRLMQAADFFRRFGERPPFAEWVRTVDPRMGELWESTAHGDGWTTIRDTAMLRWRFDRLPSTRRCYMLLSEAPGQPLSAWFACDTNARDASILTISDFWSSNGINAIDRIAIRMLCRAARSAGFHAVELHFTGSDQARSTWNAEGFVKRSAQPLYMRWLNPDLAGELEGKLHITDIDNDG